MILAVDPGIGACGWAIVEPKTGRVLDLGLWTSERDQALDKSTDRGRRIHKLSGLLGQLVRDHQCTVVAGEQALSHGPINAVIGQVLVWGALAMLASEYSAELVEVTAKEWQHAVLPDLAPKAKVDYARIEKALAAHIGDRLSHVPTAKRTHVFDAAAVGMFAALRRVTKVTSRATRGAA